MNGRKIQKWITTLGRIVNDSLPLPLLQRNAGLPAGSQGRQQPDDAHPPAVHTGTTGLHCDYRGDAGMKTIVCICDNYETRGPKQTGYCLSAMKPTWPSIVKKCQEDAHIEAGDFCWFCCPFTEDHDGYLCDDANPKIKSILDCNIFEEKLCRALGGELWHQFFYIKDAEVWECNVGWHWGVSHWRKDEDTLLWRYYCGWQRYYL